jgi:hypothetical protein
MSAKRLELISDALSRNEPHDVGSPVRVEHRRRARIQVHWPVLFLSTGSAGGAPIETITENLSSDGFYCLCTTQLPLGEPLMCSLKIPTYEPAGKHTVRTLECKIQVTRIEPHAERGLFGIACRIEDYHFVPNGSGMTH